jgi:type VI protein secretion system component VasA
MDSLPKMPSTLRMISRDKKPGSRKSRVTSKLSKKRRKPSRRLMELFQLKTKLDSMKSVVELMVSSNHCSKKRTNSKENSMISKLCTTRRLPSKQRTRKQEDNKWKKRQLKKLLRPKKELSRTDRETVKDLNNLSDRMTTP